MKLKLARGNVAVWLLWCFVFNAWNVPTASAVEEVFQLQAHLIWGTNEKASPDPNHKPVEPFILKKLHELPLKWTNYFEVNRKQLSVRASAPAKVALSDKCELEVKNIGKSSVEVCLVGKGSKVLRRTQALPKGETLVLGGNAPNATAWLVVLVRIE